jgi:hypothetical protein
VLLGQTLTFSPATATGSLTFNGTTAQTINNAGHLLLLQIQMQL